MLFALWSGDLAAARRLLALAGACAPRVVIVVRLPGANAAEIVAAANAVAPLVVAADGRLGVNVGGTERGCTPDYLLASLAPLAVDWLQIPERAGPLSAFAGSGARVLGSCHDEAGLAARIAEGADACTLSPIWPTRSKVGHRGLGQAALASACNRWPRLIVALGGVDGPHARLAFAAGAAGIAALSAPWGLEAAELVDALPTVSR